MTIHWDLKQQSPEWSELKWGKIGGSQASGLLKDTDTLFLEILSQKAEEYEPTDDFVNEHMARGNELEPFAREYVEKYTGLKFLVPGWIQSKKYDLIGISPDGITEDLKTGIEIKCLSRKEHWRCVLENEIPLKHIPQCLHFFNVNTLLEKLYFVSFRPESGRNKVFELTRDSFVNIGTFAKPKKVMVKEACELMINNLMSMGNKINVELNKSDF